MEINEVKNNIKKCVEAGKFAEEVADYLGAYNNYIAAANIAKDASKDTIDVDETNYYKEKVTQYTNLAKAMISKLNLSPEQEANLPNLKQSKGFDKFVGETTLKNYLTETVIKPWREHNFSSRKKSAILIYGPEGVSKNVFIQSIIHELDATGYRIEPINNFSSFSDNSKEYFQRLFDKANKKDNVVFYFTKPLAFFPNESNPESKRTLKMFYKLVKKELKYVRKHNLNILFIGSTAAMDKMSKKVFDKGFFDDLLRMHHPDRKTRKGLIEERLKGVEFEDKDAIDKILVPKTHGFVSKEISRLCRRIKKCTELYAKDGKAAIITNDMIERAIIDLQPMDDEYFKKVVDTFEASLYQGYVTITNDNREYEFN